jgi:SAM-dependent methyltransferase
MVVNAADGAVRIDARSDQSNGEPASRQTSSVIWHDLECGSYEADLPLWRELAAGAGTAGGTSGPTKPASPPALASALARVLDIGAGSGRVALDLARHGHHVTALDLNAELLAAIRERTDGTALETVCADARTFALERRDFALCIAPMQTIQLLGSSARRLQFLRRARAHLTPGGMLACAIVTDIDEFDCYAGDLSPSPEIAHVDGRRYISRATRVQVGKRVVRIERERSVLAPARAGALVRPVCERDVVELDRLSVEQLQCEGREAGLASAGTRVIAATEEHTASVAVIFRA